MPVYLPHSSQFEVGETQNSGDEERYIVAACESGGDLHGAAIRTVGTHYWWSLAAG